MICDMILYFGSGGQCRSVAMGPFLELYCAVTVHCECFVMREMCGLTDKL